MASLVERISDLAVSVRDKFNSLRTVPIASGENLVLTSTGTNTYSWQEAQNNNSEAENIAIQYSILLGG